VTKAEGETVGNQDQKALVGDERMVGDPVTLSPCHLVTLSPSPWRAWGYLVWLSWQRQARARQMVWISLALLAFSVALVLVFTASGRWGVPRRVEFGEKFRAVTGFLGASGQAPVGGEIANIYLGTVSSPSMAFAVFSRAIVFAIYLSFLMPIWSLSFATEALGGDRENRSLVWLLTRPLSRPAIYLAQFVAMLPWSLGLNLGGFALLCLAAGPPGWHALRLFWPAVLWGTLAFSSLFLLMGASFRRPAVVAIVYAFFLETLLGNMPGYLKRVSISFYTRCMMFEVSTEYGVEPEKPSVYLPVDGTTAWLILMAVTLGLLVVGMVLFSRQSRGGGPWRHHRPARRPQARLAGV
jgi:ABC-2 type transport system permease protein